jgi:hypothetical protein
MRASWGSPCTFQRAYVDPDNGNTTCVWDAPELEEVENLFAKASVKVNSITPVEEMTSIEKG